MVILWQIDFIASRSNK